MRSNTNHQRRTWPAAAAVLLGGIFAIATCTLRLSAASCPLFRATPQRTGAVAEYAAPKLTPRWNYRIQGQFVSSPVIYKGILYTGGRDGSILALDACSGETIWQYSTSGWVDATPCVSSDTVYVPSRDQNLYALDRLTGAIRWQTFTGSTDCSSPVLFGGKLYFLSGSPEKKLYCIDAVNGAILASCAISQFGFSSPAIKDNFLYFGTNDGRFHCYDMSNGQLKWSRATNGGIFYSSLCTGNNAVYAVSGGDEHKLYSFNPANGSINWQSVDLDTQTATVSSVTLADDRVLVACSNLIEVASYTYETRLKLFAFSLSGSLLWKTDIGIASPTGIVSSPSVADGLVYIGSGNGYLFCLRTSDGGYIAPGTGALSSPSTGFYLCTPDASDIGIVSTPAIANGWVYISTLDGLLWAFEAGDVTSILLPDNGDRVTDHATVKGTARKGTFDHYRLEYGRGENPSSWNELLISTQEVSGGILAEWDTHQLGDGQYTLRLSVNDDLSTRAQNIITLDNAPRAPASLTAGDTHFDGGGSITLSWNPSPDDGAGNNDVAGYRIYKSTFAGNYTLLTQLTKGVTEYADAACPVYTTFYYVLTAFDQASESSYSAPASAFSVADGIEITPETGGTITMETNGLSTEVVIPPGAVAQRTWVGIRIPDSPPAVPSSAAAQDTGIVREFGMNPAGAQFLKPVIIKLPYRPQDITGMARENLRIYWWDASKNEWRIVNTSDPNTENGRVLATIPHFSLYRIMEYAPGREALLSADKVYAYPNPATGDRATFKYYLGDKADITIDVYNVAGELIAHLEKAANPAGIVSEMDWNIAGIASGVYVYRLEAKSATESKAVKKKMAVIH